MSGTDKRYKILVVDDDKDDREHVKIAFGRLYDFYFAHSPESLRNILPREYVFDLILLDLELEKGSGDKIGIQLIPEIQQARPNIPIIIMTNDTNARNMRKAMKAGALDFLIKDEYERADWLEAIERGLALRETLRENKSLKARVQRQQEREDQDYAFVGESEAIRDVKNLLEVTGEDRNVTVLILGETGTGKEIAARFFHRNSARSDQPFIAVNLSAIPDTLLESTLFGSLKGAYTGSTRDQEGYFRQANGGILMLDEIGDINHDIQIKLLRFLEDRVIRPVGSDKDIKLDLQIVAATHQNLAKAVEKGTFRRDLYMRLKSQIVELPPLRERRDDIAHIVQHYLGPNRPYEKLVAAPARRILYDYSWPGNVRELRDTVPFMLRQLKLKGIDTVDESCLPSDIRLSFGTVAPAGTPALLLETRPFNSLAEEVEWLRLTRIEEALREKNKVKKDVAEKLKTDPDLLLSSLKTSYKNYPALFENGDFPFIRESYKQIFK